ncbi:MAG: competence/damage-inducible protein A [Syntrophales bacterium]|nr:competence/damage-inducible protein A [Syntrophales bacterium]
MNIGIMTIGNELTSGRVTDANAAMIARHVVQEGWWVAAMCAVPDQLAAIKRAMDFLLAQAEAVVVTGGLGPTADDMTTAAVAEIFQRPLYTDEAVLAHIKNIFSTYGLKWTDNNAKQAVFPQGATIIPNPTGTAPGFAIRTEGKTVAVIPGVPAEAARMLQEGVLPLLRQDFPQAVRHRAMTTFKTFGLSEAAVDEALADLHLDRRGIEVGFSPQFPENHVVLSILGGEKAVVERRLAEAAVEVSRRLASYIFARDDEPLEGVVARLLTERGLTIAVAESCTGGLITDRLTDVPGSSSFLERGVVVYANAAKTALLGVPGEIIDTHGAVSEATARLMAEGVRALAKTDLGLASTGIAGPSGGTPEKPVGTVFIALADGRETLCRHYRFRWHRRRNKVIAAQAALMMLRHYLQGKDHHGP